MSADLLFSAPPAPMVAVTPGDTLHREIDGMDAISLTICQPEQRRKP
jgi:hypothetical protein